MSKEHRNLRRMLAVIAAARASETSLVEAVDSLLFLGGSLELPHERWEPAFTSLLANLESAGLASDDQIANMGEVYNRLVSNSLSNLETMILEALGALGDEDEEGSE